MRRRHSFRSSLAAMEREGRRLQRVQRAAQRALEIEGRRLDRQSKLDYVAGRAAEAEDRTRDVTDRVESLKSILVDVLSMTPRLNFERLKQKAKLPRFDAKGLDRPEPGLDLATFIPPPLNFLERLLPPLVQRHETRSLEAHAVYEGKVLARTAREKQRIEDLTRRKTEYNTECERITVEATEQNAEIDAFAAAFGEHEPDAVISYFSIMLDDDELPDDLPHDVRVAYVPESKQLVIERHLPTLGVVPEQSSFRYVKKTDSIEPVQRKASEVRSLYADLLAQIALRTLWLVVHSDYADAVSVVAFNGFVDTIDPGTGNRIKPTLISLSTTKESLLAIAFERVEPTACLRSLKALVSRSAHELEAVRPLVSFDMVDKRFIDKGDVLAELDSRPNLADLTPGEFEVLMTNLFEKMGLETRLTQASRDGGVDCVAWDMRPVVGGKVVIQAKRYKNTVGVSAVRDLYGTMMNEGAAKGILVATSGYGDSAYEFAKNKPIELITGSNLLSMLDQYAGVQARIDFPAGWQLPESAETPDRV